MRQAIEVSSWASWKTLLRTKLMLMKYFDNGVSYDLYLEDGIITWHYSLLKEAGAEQTDFETNYKDIRYANRDFYSAAMIGGVSPATPTDVFTITGSATKIVKVWAIGFSGIKTTAGMIDYILLRRSSANAGGTSSTRSNVSHDTNSPAGTAVVRHYTANPATLGTLVGNMFVDKIPVSGGTGAVPIEDALELRNPVVLDGVAQVLAINLNSVTQSGNNLNFHITWSEE